MSEINIEGSILSSGLSKLLMSDSIEPGTSPSYQLCKTIFTEHPLGAKMAESPIKMAQAQKRVVTIQESPDEVLEAFEEQWKKDGCDAAILNVMTLSRIYGLATTVAVCDQVAPGSPLDMTKIWDQSLSFNALDPLNTAGSLVLSQIPTATDFQKPVRVMTNGVSYHPSRFVVVMNEQPIYISYTGSAFGFVGRSVYQRALFPLKSFVRLMIANDLIATKLALLIAKQKAPGSIINQAMQKIAGNKRNLLKEGQTGNVLSIDIAEDIETLNMQNVDGAGTFARTNVLNDVATAGDMPAKILKNETMVGGMAEGTEDAKHIALYVDELREKMDPLYAWHTGFTQYRAWTPALFERIQAKYPERYKSVQFEDAFSEWRNNFSAQWPSFLIEPESEKQKAEKTKLEGITAIVEMLLPVLDPQNKATLIQSALDNINENKRMFAHEFQIDAEALLEFLEEKRTQENEAAEAANQALSEGPEAKKLGRFG